jgi:hypothetical protein
MATWQTASALSFPKLERTVKQDFWTALKQFAGRLPFVEDLVAAYLRARSGYAHASTRCSARSACLLHLPMALSTIDIALAWPRIYR